jgi:hypothetical protein
MSFGVMAFVVALPGCNHIHLKYHQVLQFGAGMGVFAERIPVDYVVRTVVHVLFVESALVAMVAGMVVNTEADVRLPISQLLMACFLVL